MSKKQVSSRTLSIYLIKEGIAEYSQIIPSAPELKKYSVLLSSVCKGTLYLKRAKTHQPKWIELFESAISFAAADVESCGPSAVLLVPWCERVFVLTFGYGRSLLDRDTCEENFGLRVTVNSIDADKVRVVDRQSLEAVPKHTTEQTSLAMAVEQFAMNVELDLVRSLNGIPMNSELGTRLAGTDAVSTTAKVDLAGIPALLERYLAKFADTVYKKRFSFIDYIAEVSKPALLKALDTVLFERIEKKKLSRLWLAVPELLDWNQVGGFRYSTSKKSEVHADIHFETFLPTIKSESISKKYLSLRKVFCISAADDHVVGAWSVYRCIYAEIDRQDKTYLLTDGKWYCVDPDFVRKVNNYVRSIRKSKIKFPLCGNIPEIEYNRRFCKTDPNHLAFMDGKLIPHGGGHSKIEFCDIYTSDGTMIHVKNYSGSSGLSHLYSQGTHAAELFLQDPEFRQKVNGKLPKTHKVSQPKNYPDPKDYRVVFAVISRSKKALVLPFFSRLSLRNAVRRLNAMGFSVSIAKIQRVPKES